MTNKNLLLGPKWGLTPRWAGRLTVGRNIILTLTMTSVFKGLNNNTLLQCNKRYSKTEGTTQL
jgi:hypothetical protein